MTDNNHRSDSPEAIREAREALAQGAYSRPEKINWRRRAALGVAASVLAATGIVLAEGPSDAELEDRTDHSTGGIEQNNPNDPVQVEQRLLERVAEANQASEATADGLVSPKSN